MENRLHFSVPAQETGVWVAQQENTIIDELCLPQVAEGSVVHMPSICHPWIKVP